MWGAYLDKPKSKENPQQVRTTVCKKEALLLSVMCHPETQEMIKAKDPQLYQEVLHKLAEFGVNELNMHRASVDADGNIHFKPQSVMQSGYYGGPSTSGVVAASGYGSSSSSATRFMGPGPRLKQNPRPRYYDPKHAKQEESDDEYV